MTRRLCTSICLIALLCQIVPGQSPEKPTGQAAEQSTPQSSVDAQKLIIPEGTELQLSLREPLSSKLNEPGDEVYAVIRRDVVVEGRTLLRQGTEVVGRVTAAQPAKRML